MAFKLVEAQSIGKVVGALAIGINFGDFGKTFVHILPKEMKLHIQSFRAV